MSNIKFKNLAGSVLTAAVTTTATAITINPSDVAKFPVITGDEYFIVVAVDGAGDFEIMRVVAVSANTFTVIRAQEGTAAKTFAIGDKLEHRLTAESLVNIVTEASITKPHTSADGSTYGQATNTLYSHVKLTDDPMSSAASTLGIAVTPLAVKTRFDQLLGASSQTILTASTSYTVPVNGTYEIICVGAGGAGGTGGKASEGATAGGTFLIGSGGGAGGGGAGQVITQRIALTKDTVIPVIVGASGGNSSFGSYITALAGVRGADGGDCTGCGCNCSNPANYAFSGPGAGGAGGYSYGTLASVGTAGTSMGYAFGNCAGGLGGNGGVSSEGTYGNGGTGGQGQSVSNPQVGCSTSYFGNVAGVAGTQGCVKIRLVTGS